MATGLAATHQPAMLQIAYKPTGRRRSECARQRQYTGHDMRKQAVRTPWRSRCPRRQARNPERDVVGDETIREATRAARSAGRAPDHRHAAVVTAEVEVPGAVRCSQLGRVDGA